MMMELMKMMILEAILKMLMGIPEILLIKLFIMLIIWPIWAPLSINLMLKNDGGRNKRMINLNNLLTNSEPKIGKELPVSSKIELMFSVFTVGKKF
jgi:hypothetical protein